MRLFSVDYLYSPILSLHQSSQQCNQKTFTVFFLKNNAYTSLKLTASKEITKQTYMEQILLLTTVLRQKKLRIGSVCKKSQKYYPQVFVKKCKISLVELLNCFLMILAYVLPLRVSKSILYFVCFIYKKMYFIKFI